VSGGLRFALYWRVSTEDHQDPVTSRQWQFDRASALLAALADPDRGFDAVVIGSHERAFSGNQYSLVAPLFTLLGIIAKREVSRARARATNAMTARFATRAGMKAAGLPTGTCSSTPGRTPTVGTPVEAGSCSATTSMRKPRWMFASRLAGFSLARITRALNGQAIPCPSAEDPEANPHRTGEEWTLGTVREILANPAYVGRMVWGRFRVDYELVDPTNTGLGHRRTRHRVSPDKWVISVTRPHPALVSEADFITVQSMRATRLDARHEYRLKGLLQCALCERRFEGHWVNDTPGYRCRHGHTSAKDPDTQRVKSVYLREDRVLAKLPLLHHMLTAAEPVTVITGAPASAARHVPPTPEEVIDHLREHALELSYGPRTRRWKTAANAPCASPSEPKSNQPVRRNRRKEEPGTRDPPSRDCRRRETH
jgi:hypothetical protein